MPTTKSKVEKKINKLRDEVNKHNYLYYVKDSPIISDSEFDLLLKELIDLEKKYPEFISSDSPTQRVGGEITEGFSPFKHINPMMSVDNVSSEKEALEFDKRIKRFLNTEQNINYVAQPKFDGVSASLTYKDGILTSGATRGNGTTGEDITNNLKTVKSIPLKLDNNSNIPSIIEVRGEVIFPLKKFKLLNKELVEKGEPPFANPRNSASGSLRQLDPSITATRPLDFYAWGIGFFSEYKFDYEWDIMRDLIKWGFKVENEIQLCKNIDEAIEYQNRMENVRDKFHYEMDGVVLKVNDIEFQKRLGTTAKYPRWSVAYKFKPKEASTKINDITVQVGRVGLLTPVAELEPVNIGGITVKRASLHTEDIIKNKDIRIGDTVMIQRAGDVIPDVIKPVKEKRTGDEKAFKMPSKCPVCNTVVEKEGSYYYCPNISCEAQIKGRIQQLASRISFDIQGLGEKIINHLLKEKIIKNIADIFYLKKEDIVNLERFADKSADNLIYEIEKSKSIEFDRFLVALSMKHVGTRLSEILANNFSSLDELINSTYDDLILIDTVGPEIAASIVNFFSNSDNIKLINRLLDSGIEILYPEKTSNISHISDMSFVLTGTLETLSRNEAKNKINQLGGKVSSSLSKNTDFLIVGEKPGSKLKKANELGIKVLSEKEFLELFS